MNLEQLHAASRLALDNAVLKSIAMHFSPTASYEEALHCGFSEEQAKSCRFLAIIVRDHGMKGVEESAQKIKESHLQKFLHERLLPRLEVLEVVAGAPLMIVLEDRSLPLADFLKAEKPLQADWTLAVGEYRIRLSWIDESSGRAPATKQSVEVTHQERMLQRRNSSLMGGAARMDRFDVRMDLYRFVIDAIVSLTSYPHKSALLLIRDHLAGVKTFPPRLYETYVDRLQWKLERYGLVAQQRSHCDKVLAEARASACEQGIAFLEYEIAEAMRATEESNAWLDPSVSLVEKLASTSCYTVEAIVVPGKPAGKTYAFLLDAEWVNLAWLEILLKKGYAGSLLISYYNRDQGCRIAETGQIDGFMLQPHGFSCKAYQMDKLQSAMKEAQAARGNANANVPTLPKCPDIDYFSQFLDDHFPLT